MNALQEQIETFISTKRNKETVRKYTTQLNEFATWLKENYPSISHPKEVTARVFVEYRDYLENQGIKPSTVLSKMIPIRSLFNALKATGVIPYNELSIVELPSSEDVECDARPLSTSEVKKLFSSVDTKTTEGLIEDMILTILFRIAPRRMEIAKIKFGDFRKNDTGATVRFKIKRERYRQVDITLKTYEKIMNYKKKLEKKRGEAYGDNDFVIQSIRANGKLENSLNPSTIYRRFMAIANRANIKDVSPHSARATLAVKFFDLGCSVQEVMHFFCWKNIKTALRYDKKTRRISSDILSKLEV